MELIRGGYIEAHAQITAFLQELVQAEVKGDRAVVAAIQSYQCEKAAVFQGVFGGVTNEDPLAEDFGYN